MVSVCSAVLFFPQYHWTTVALEQMPCVSPKWCFWAASQESTPLTSSCDQFLELMVGCEVKNLHCVTLLCVVAGDWDSRGHNANQQSCPQGTAGNTGMWGWALAVFAPSGCSPGLIRAALKQSQREFGCGGRTRLYGFFFLHFASFTECRYVSTIAFFSNWAHCERLRLAALGRQFTPHLACCSCQLKFLLLQGGHFTAQLVVLCCWLVNH